jgi:hypothetical protein
VEGVVGDFQILMLSVMTEVQVEVEVASQLLPIQDNLVVQTRQLQTRFKVIMEVQVHLQQVMLVVEVVVLLLMEPMLLLYQMRQVKVEMG